MSKYKDTLNTGLNIDKSIYNIDNAKILGYLPKTYCLIKDNILISSDEENAEYIVKFSNEGIESVSENEHFFLWMSSQCNINTSESMLHENPNDYMLMSKKFDKDKQIIHLADMFTGKERREISLEKTLNLIDDFDISVSGKQKIQEELFKQFSYSNIIGNFDLHAYNVAFLYDSNGELELAPAYDIVCTQVYDDFTRSAICVFDKKKDVTIEDLTNCFRKNSLLSDEIIYNVLFDINSGIKLNLSQIEDSFMAKEDSRFAYGYIESRNNELSKLIENIETERDISLKEYISQNENSLEISQV